MTLLRCKGLVKDYPLKRAVDGVDFDVEPGEIVGLLGPNGAGKSTVLHAIFGFNNIFSGSIRIGDGNDKRDVTKLSPNQTNIQENARRCIEAGADALTGARAGGHGWNHPSCHAVGLGQVGRAGVAHELQVGRAGDAA